MLSFHNLGVEKVKQAHELRLHQLRLFVSLEKYSFELGNIVMSVIKQKEKKESRHIFQIYKYIHNKQTNKMG